MKHILYFSRLSVYLKKKIIHVYINLNNFNEAVKYFDKLAL